MAFTAVDQANFPCRRHRCVYNLAYFGRGENDKVEMHEEQCTHAHGLAASPHFPLPIVLYYGVCIIGVLFETTCQYYKLF